MKKIIVFDLETTGLDKTKNYIIQISAIKYNKETGEKIDELNEYVRPNGNYSIDMGAYFKHHIKPDFLMNKPTLNELAPKIVEFFEDVDVDILTYNGNSFDIPFLIYRLDKIGYYIDFVHRNCYDAFLEEKRRHPNTLEGTYERYMGKSMTDNGLEAHNAFSDIQATQAIFEAQNNENEVLPEKMYGDDGTIKEMVFQDKLCPCFSFGKYRQISVEFVSTIDQGYLKWCVEKSNFSKNTKEFIKKYLK